MLFTRHFVIVSSKERGDNYNTLSLYSIKIGNQFDPHHLGLLEMNKGDHVHYPCSLPYRHYHLFCHRDTYQKISQALFLLLVILNP